MSTPYDDALAYAVEQETAANQAIQAMQPALQEATAALETLETQEAALQTEASNWASSAAVLQTAVDGYVPPAS